MRYLKSLLFVFFFMLGCDEGGKVSLHDTIHPDPDLGSDVESPDVVTPDVAACEDGMLLADGECVPEDFDGCDGVDNDEDGETDEDCPCGPGTVYVDGHCVLEEICDDGIDNDLDGETDEDCEDCGNGTLDPGELCDGEELGDATCATRGFADGELGCTDDCYYDTTDCNPLPPELCGNGTLDPGELCDGDQLGGVTCDQLPSFIGGELACDDECMYDTTDCDHEIPPTCGDDAIDDGEQCDGTELGNATCESEGFASGTLVCVDCFFDTAGCTLCGNGEIDDGEECDGENLNDQECADLGFAAGTLSCENCEFNTAQCTDIPELCGNGEIDNNEQCDGDELGGSTCESLGWGYTGGVLACSSCEFDTTGCTPVCGNGTCELDETHQSCPEDCEEVCDPQISFLDLAAGTELQTVVVSHVAQIHLAAVTANVTVENLTFNVNAQNTTPNTSLEEWRLKTETGLIIATYTADVTGDGIGQVVFELDPIQIQVDESRTLDVFVNTYEFDPGDYLQLILETACGMVEGPILTVP